ncbi:MAG: peptide ABC transporter permease [Alphaproteobacteria bacterium]|nr:peptide ABC transporter permease [Alphaproteobacteria bacterium]
MRGDDARQGEIILKTRQQRIMFIGGLVALVVVVVVAFWLAR